MGNVVELFPKDDTAIQSLETLKEMIEAGRCRSFVICATLDDNTVASVIHQPGIDLYTLIGLVEAVKSELLDHHEVSRA